MTDTPHFGNGDTVRNIDKTGGKGLFTNPDPDEEEEPNQEEELTGLTIKFIDTQGNAITTPIRSGTLTKEQADHKYKFGMLFDIHATYMDDAGKAIAAKDVRLRADRATLKKWGKHTDALTAKTDAEGVAHFTDLYLVDAKDTIEIIAEADDKSVTLEINTDASTPDCYATFNHNKYSNYATSNYTFTACGTQQTSTALNKFVDIPASCASKIGTTDMYLDLNLFRSTVGNPYEIKEHYNGSYNGVHGDCTVMPLNLLGRNDHSDLHTDTAINLYDANYCVVSEFHVHFPTLPLIVYDQPAGNGSCK